MLLGRSIVMMHTAPVLVDLLIHYVYQVTQNCLLCLSQTNPVYYSEQNTKATILHLIHMTTTCPCAVCRNKNTTSTIMIPGRELCYAGWTKEYQGLLAGGHVAYTASNFICVDKTPEYVPSGEKNENGHLFYVVNIQCGPLPFPLYHSNHKVNFGCVF